MSKNGCLKSMAEGAVVGNERLGTHMGVLSRGEIRTRGRWSWLAGHRNCRHQRRQVLEKVATIQEKSPQGVQGLRRGWVTWGLQVTQEGGLV